MDQILATNIDVDIDVHEWLSQHGLDQNSILRQHQIRLARAESKVGSKIAVLNQILSVLGGVKADLQVAEEEESQIKWQIRDLSDNHRRAGECEKLITDYSAQLEELSAQIADFQSSLQTLNETYNLLPYEAEFIRDEMLTISQTQTFSTRSTRDFRGRAEPPLEIRCLLSAINQFYILSKGLPMHSGSELSFFCNNDGAIIQFIKDYQFQNITSEVISESISLLRDYSEASYLNTNQFCHQLFQWLHFLRSFYEQNSEKLELKTEISKLSLALVRVREQASELEDAIRSEYETQKRLEAKISNQQQMLPTLEQRLAEIELHKKNLKCNYLDMIDDFKGLLVYYQTKLNMAKFYSLRSVLLANLVHSKKTETLSIALKALADKARASGALQHPWKSKLLCFNEFFSIVLSQGKGVFLFQDHDKIIDYWIDYLEEFKVQWESCNSLRELEKASSGLVIFYHQPQLKRQEIEEILERNWLKKVLYVILPEQNVDQIPQLPYLLKLSEENLEAALTCDLTGVSLIDFIKRVRKLMRSQEDLGNMDALLRNPMPDLEKEKYNLSGVPVLLETYFLSRDILKQFWTLNRLHAIFRCEGSFNYFDDYEQQLGDFESFCQKHENYQVWKKLLIRRITPCILNVIQQNIYMRTQLNITHQQFEMVYLAFQKINPEQSVTKFVQFVRNAVEEFGRPDKKKKFQEINQYLKDLWRMENLRSEAEIKEGICTIQARLIEQGLRIKKINLEIEECTINMAQIELKIQEEQANQIGEMHKMTQNIEIKASDLYEVLQGRRSVTSYEWQLCSLLLKSLNVQPTILELRNQLQGQKIQRLNQSAFIELLNDQTVASIEEIVNSQKEFTTALELKLTEFFKCTIQKYLLKKQQDEVNQQLCRIQQLQQQKSASKEQQLQLINLHSLIQAERQANQQSEQRADQMLRIFQEHSQHSEALSYILEIRNNVSRLYELSSGDTEHLYLLDALVDTKRTPPQYLILALLPKHSKVNYRINLIDHKSYCQINRVLYSYIIKEFIIEQSSQYPNNNFDNGNMENGIQLIINDFVQSYLSQLQIEGENLPPELIPYAKENLQDCKSGVLQLSIFKHFKEVEKQVKLLARITWILWQHSLTQVLDPLMLFDKSSSTYIAKVHDRHGFRAIYEKILQQMDRIQNSEKCRAQLNEFLRSASQENDLIDITIIKD